MLMVASKTEKAVKVKVKVIDLGVIWKTSIVEYASWISNLYLLQLKKYSEG